LEGMVVAKSRDDLGNPHGETKPLRTADVPGRRRRRRRRNDISSHSVTQMSSVVYEIMMV
jgi:hypothetical protein